MEFAHFSKDLEQLSFNHFRCATSLGEFKSCYSQHTLPTDHNSQFSVRITKGQNFKIGLALSNAPTEGCFADHKTGMAFYSAGQLRGAACAQYGVKYGAGDEVTCFVDTYSRQVSFSVNGVFQGVAFDVPGHRKGFYAAVSCLCKNEEFEVLLPAAED